MRVICPECKMRTMIWKPILKQEFWYCTNCEYSMPYDEVMETKYEEAGRDILGRNKT